MSDAGPVAGRRALLGGALGSALGGAISGVLGGALIRPARAQARPVRIGVLTDESGPYADIGGPGSLVAARLAAQDAGGSVLGRAIEILHADGQNKPGVAGTIARAWYDDGVDAITDLPLTPVAAAAQQVAREKGRTVMIAAAATHEFTSQTCAPTSSHWAVDTHAMATAVARGITASGGKTWYFISVDNRFGAVMQQASTDVIAASGGQVLGSVKYPVGNGDFSSQIVQAQSSGAKVIGLASVGGDQVNLIKQSAEFGLAKAARMASFVVYICDIHALGLPVAQGLTFPAAFYWNLNAPSRAFAARFMAERHVAPTQCHALVYAATLHFLKAMAKAGTDDPLAVNRAMRALPIDLFGRPATMREDGRVLYDVMLFRVKRPDESHAPWDYYAPAGSLPAAEAFLPVNPACRAA